MAEKKPTKAELEKLNDELAKEGQTEVNTDNLSEGGEHIVYANENDEA